MAKAHILIVEDESIIALDIKSTLENLGYAVIAIVPSGAEAIRIAGEEHPDLVLMDIRLKGDMDGVQAAEQIRADYDVPVVYLTAHADDATLQRAKVTQAFGFILKPFEDRELHTTIEIALYKHEMEHRLKESESWLAATLKSIGDAVIATDAQGCIQFMNPVAEALTGWPQAEAQGKAFEQVFHIIHQETRCPAENPIARVFREQVVVDLGENILLAARDGKEIPIDDSAAPIRDEHDRLTGVVIVFRDISERVQAAEALRQYALELQARNDSLDAFAHTVAHDLKAPLNPIIGFAQILHEGYATLPREHVHEYLEMIVRSGRKMANIIEELLLLAQVQTQDIKTRPLAMDQVVIEVEQRLTYLIEEYQAQVILPERWPSALGYAPWVEEVWANYLSNAIKYGGQPPRLELGADVEPDGMIRFWVHDNGGGLTLEEQARLFTPFTQLGQVRATGHGLGLSIVQRIVEELGGQVGVESQPGQGSTFSFTLPPACQP